MPITPQKTLADIRETRCPKCHAPRVDAVPRHHPPVRSMGVEFFTEHLNVVCATCGYGELAYCQDSRP